MQPEPQVCPTPCLPAQDRLSGSPGASHTLPGPHELGASGHLCWGECYRVTWLVIQRSPEVGPASSVEKMSVQELHKV